MKIEIHDGVWHVGRELIPRILWDTDTERIGRFFHKVPRAEYTAIILLSTIFQNSNNFYSCIDGDICLRDYFDLHTLFSSCRGKVDWFEVEEILRAFSMEEVAEAVFSNYEDLFQADSLLDNVPSMGAFRACSSSGFSERFDDREKCVEWAFAQIRDECRVESLALRNSSLMVTVEDSERLWNRYENRYGLDIMYAILVDSEGVRIIWSFPDFMTEKSELFSFKMSFITSFEQRHLQLCVNIWNVDSGYVSYYYHSDRMEQRFCPDKVGGLLLAESGVLENRATVSVFVKSSVLGWNCCDIARGVGVIPVVFQEVAWKRYHSIGIRENEFLSPLVMVIGADAADSGDSFVSVAH